MPLISLNPVLSTPRAETPESRGLPLVFISDKAQRNLLRIGPYTRLEGQTTCLASALSLPVAARSPTHHTRGADGLFIEVLSLPVAARSPTLYEMLSACSLTCLLHCSFFFRWFVAETA
jgi:hypothetical protein